MEEPDLEDKREISKNGVWPKGKTGDVTISLQEH